jgi:hypothetical protein
MSRVVRIRLRIEAMDIGDRLRVQEGRWMYDGVELLAFDASRQLKWEGPGHNAHVEARMVETEAVALLLAGAELEIFS